jgi:hypothetical protein
MDNFKAGKYKDAFKTDLRQFADKLRKHISTDTGDWAVKGFIDIYKNIYTISSDTKIVSKILEIHLFPQILQFADSIGYHIVLAEKQNYYPDLSFVHKDNDKIKFAVDIKTTFRRNDSSVGFTLGSHGAYFIHRDKAKNIQFPYNQYSGHFVLGVIYTRVDFSDETDGKIYRVDELKEGSEKLTKKVGARQVTKVKNLKSIASVIRDFDFFVAEKWKIASDFQGSHNTANIGCAIDLEDLKNENGAFSKLGEGWFDEYWQNYGHITRKGKKITNLKDYLDFKGKPELWKKITTKILRNK